MIKKLNSKITLEIHKVLDRWGSSLRTNDEQLLAFINPFDRISDVVEALPKQSKRRFVYAELNDGSILLCEVLAEKWNPKREERRKNAGMEFYSKAIGTV